MTKKLRNVAIIAHVDHGKTTLVDQMLQQSGTLSDRKGDVTRILDSQDLEKERGITILSKNTAISWQDYQINIVDTPGHADFGGEVERILSMVDSVLLLVDAVDGPMPQTRFVTQKAFAQGLDPILVINKIDRVGARPEWVVDQVFELFDNLGASDHQLDFPVIYCSALEGTATTELQNPKDNLQALFEMIVQHVPQPDCDRDGPFQMQISSLDYSSYVGTIGIGRIHRGKIGTNQPVTVVDAAGMKRQGRILQIFGYHGLEKVEKPEAAAGDIIAMTGISPLYISDTLCDPKNVESLPALTVDEPTISMNFLVNTSPFAGKSGKYLTSRQLDERLQRECLHNVALKVEQTENPDKFKISGRGELHLSILIETMRREGYELAVSRPTVILREIEGVIEEPYEHLTVDVDANYQGALMEALGYRQGECQNLLPDGKGRVRLDYIIPSNGLIGFQTEFMTLTSGTGIMTHVFDHYGPRKEVAKKSRRQGVLIANQAGKASAFALWNLQARGKLFIPPQTAVYEGMIVGLHSRDNDLVVNAIKGKQLTNVRAAGTDENIMLTPPVRMSLEQALGFIRDDELVEITPDAIRLRKRYLKEHERRREARQ